MRYFNYVCIGTALLFNQAACAQTLAASIDELIEKQLPRATVGVLIKDVQTGDVIYSKNADKLLSPASSMKLFTAAASLYQLKPDYRFLTTLSQKGQNYYLTFSGSPSLTETNLAALLAVLKKNNVSAINGNIVIDSSQYQAPYYPSGNSFDDFGWYYSAPDTAAILNGNAESYELISAEALGKPATIKAKSASKALTVINNVMTVSREEEKGHCSLHVENKENNTIRIFGCAAKTKDPKTLELAIPDPVFFIKQVTKNVLAKNGIALQGDVVSGTTPADAQIIARFQSGDLVKLVTRMLQKSDNLYANSLTKKLGYTVTGKGTHKEGAFAIKKIIAAHTPLDMTQMELVDGEGTRYNLVAPEHFVTLLSTLYQDQSMQPVFLKALPQSGVSGSLQGRMKDSILEKKVFAKTGTMHDVSSLSGYVINPNSKSFVFSIIINGVNKPIEKAKRLEENILLAVENYYLENNNS